MTEQEREYEESWESANLERTEQDLVSHRGRLAARLIERCTGDILIGKKIKNGEIRKRLQEPAWKVPDCFVMRDIPMADFSMKYLESRQKPDRQKVILQLHGGGYIGAIRNTYYVFAGLYNEVSHGCSVLVPDYRVAPEYVFPCALQDCLRAYEWLLDQGWFGEQIILAGDSAGGGLAMALTHYLKDHRMPMPCGIIAMSPWTDVACTGASYQDNYQVDVMFGNTRESMIYQNDYVEGADKYDPYLSPLYGDFRDFPPMLLQVGSNEMLLSDSLQVAAKAKSQGCRVKLSVYEGMFHVFQMGYLAIPESKKAWQEVGRFIEAIRRE